MAGFNSKRTLLANACWILAALGYVTPAQAQNCYKAGWGTSKVSNAANGSKVVTVNAGTYWAGGTVYASSSGIKFGLDYTIDDTTTSYGATHNFTMYIYEGGTLLASTSYQRTTGGSETVHATGTVWTGAVKLSKGQHILTVDVIVNTGQQRLSYFGPMIVQFP